MQFRRTSLGDQRRRRVLNGDSEETPASHPNKGTKSDAVTKAYADAALAETEARLADLIPVRPLGIFVLTLLGLIGVFGIQAAAIKLPQMAATLGAQNVTAFSLQGNANLASWFSAMVLAVAAVQATMIYVIRRHKADDYRGRYRMWLWAAGLLVLASIDTVAPWHNAVAAIGNWLTGAPLFGVEASWWLVAAGVIYGGLAVRVAIDMRRCWVAVLALVACLATYSMAASLHWVTPLAHAGLSAMAISFTATMAPLMLWFTLTLYCRHVLLDARGLLPPRRKRAKKVKAPKVKKASTEAKPEEESSAKKSQSGQSVKVDPPHNNANQPKSKSKKRRKATTSSVAATASDTTKTAAKSTNLSSNQSSGATAVNSGEEDEHGPAEGSPEWFQIPKSERRRIKKLRRRQK